MEIKRCDKCGTPLVVPSIPWPATVSIMILTFIASVLILVEIKWKLYGYDSLPPKFLEREHFDKFSTGMKYDTAANLTPLGPGIQTYAREIVEKESSQQQTPVEIISRDEIGNEMRLCFENGILTRKELLWSIKNKVTQKKISESARKAVGLD
jgi:hypothetical protein